MAELDDFVKRLGKEPMPADPLQRGLETIVYGSRCSRLKCAA